MGGVSNVIILNTLISNVNKHTGKKFNMLTIMNVDISKTLKEQRRELESEIKRADIYWECLCECGRVTSVSNNELLYGGTKSCGCRKKISLDLRNAEVKNLSLHDWLMDKNLLKYWDSENKKSPKEINFKSNKKVIMKCNNPQHPKFLITCSHLVVGGWCPVCTNKKVVKGVNDVATTHPHLVKYFVDKEDSTCATYGSSKLFSFKCDRCGYKKTMKMADISHIGNFVCQLCGEGVSYPNKILANVLSQLMIDFKSEYSPNWAKSKRYDFYIASCGGLIIEAHGSQHYESGFASLGGRSLDEEKANDKMKRDFALSNGIKHYVEIDCRRSKLDWIKSNIMSSELPLLLNFKEEDIDWLECESKAISQSKLVDACKIWNMGCKSSTEIARILGIDRSTAREYLKRGEALGICGYSKKSANSEKAKRSNKQRMKAVVCYCSDGNIYHFDSCNDAARKSKEIIGKSFSASYISNRCNKKHKQNDDIIFKYTIYERECDN